MQNIAPRHRVFISADERDEKFKARVAKFFNYDFENETKESIFISSDFTSFITQDTGQSDDEIITSVREHDLKKATVFILLCGKNTKDNIQVDWQLRAAMEHKVGAPRLAIVVINLPSIEKKQAVRRGLEAEGKYISPMVFNRWRKVEERKDYEKLFPYLPKRIIDNFESELTDNNIFSISVINYDTIAHYHYYLQALVNSAYNRIKKSNTYYNIERPLLRSTTNGN